MAKIGTPERRQEPRVKGNFSIQIADQKSKIIAHTLNISSTGIYCQSNSPLSLFREISILMHLPGSSKPLEISGAVVRCDKITGKKLYNLAIFFWYLAPREKKSLSKYIEEELAKESE